VGDAHTPVLTPQLGSLGSPLLIGAMGKPTVLGARYRFGSVFSALPASASVQQVYEFTQDEGGPATAPLLAVDARGMGYHTLFVLTAKQGWLHAFDPLTLASGPLYVVQAVPGSAAAFNVDTRFLTMTHAGHMALTYTRSGFTHVALVMNATEPRARVDPGTGPAAAAGMSGGQKFGVAVAVIGSLAVVGAMGLWWAKRAGYAVGRVGDAASNAVDATGRAALAGGRWVADKVSAARGGSGGSSKAPLFSSFGSASGGGGGRGSERATLVGEASRSGGGGDAISAAGGGYNAGVPYTDL
jgi:hypothetical protein